MRVLWISEEKEFIDKLKSGHSDEQEDDNSGANSSVSAIFYTGFGNICQVY